MNYLGMVAFGDHKYTKLALSALVPNGLPLTVVLTRGNEEDIEEWIHQRFDAHIIWHDYNKGFPAGINDIMDYVFGEQGAENLIFVGNDTIAFPNTVDALIRAANAKPEFDYFSARELNVKTFLDRYPQFRSEFGENLKLGNEKFDGWKHFYRDWKPRVQEKIYKTSFINGFHNFALIRRSYFETVGYVDVGFYPAYYEDRDYVNRGFAANMRHAELHHAMYFHFWSRVAQENSPMLKRFYPLNANHFVDKWGGTPERTLEKKPFPNQIQTEDGPKDVYGTFDRSLEDTVIQYWRWTPRLLRNIHPRQRCIIACNGPGLNDIDMSLLQDEVVFGLNRGYLKEDMPITYHVAVNPQVWQGFEEEYRNLNVEALFAPQGVDELWTPKTYGLKFKPDEEFTGDMAQPIWQGHTVTFVALQIAYSMGFKDAIVIGCNHEFKQAEGLPTNHPIETEGADVDHFDPNYFPDGHTWDTPNLPKSEKAYALAQEAYRKRGGRIINASTETKLKVFEQMSLEEALA